MYSTCFFELNLTNGFEFLLCGKVKGNCYDFQCSLIMWVVPGFAQRVTFVLTSQFDALREHMHDVL